MVDSVSVRLKTLACRKNAFKYSYSQWNAGTARVSECVLKTLACRGLHVGPSKVHLIFHRQVSFAKSRLSGTSELRLLVEEREHAGAGFG